MARKKSKKNNKAAEAAQVAIETTPETKSEIVPEVSPEKTADISGDSFSPPCLSAEELFRLRALEAESRVAALESKLLVMERNAFLSKVDPEGKLASWAKAIEIRKELVQEKKTTYLRTISNIEKRLNISMSDYSFDDESGQLNYVK